MAELLPAIAFDEWIANGDRTLGNLLFAGQGNFRLIDHGEALPNWMDRSNHKLANRLARHLVAGGQASRPSDWAQLVLASCSNFGAVDFKSIEEAARADDWGGQPQFGECVRLLADRLKHLPSLIEEEFRVGQGQLLA